MTKLDEIRKRVQLAHEHICALAKDVNKWRMSVPVQADDSDILLQAPLDDNALLLRIVERQAKALRDVDDNCSTTSEIGRIARECIAEVDKMTGGKDVR